MGAIPGSIETDTQPPMTIPLRHFLVGLLSLFCGVLIGVLALSNAVPGRSTLAHVHLLLVGWVCLTIMGAMTQFVPVWSGVTLYSSRLANSQLLFVGVGLTGFVTALLTSSFVWLIPFGSLMLAGFWTFVYNIAQTLRAVEEYDRTETHFIVALGFFILLTLLGLLLATRITHPSLITLGFDQAQLIAAHATVAVFGAVMTTIYGALYQLGTMFTQTELHGVDISLQRFETIAHPVGVLLLAGGRLLEVSPIASAGGILVLGAAMCISVILGRKLLEMQVPRTPMHTRYGVVVGALASWAVLSIPGWVRAPTEVAHRFGGPGSAHLLGLGVIGFVVLGTLYHIIPFIIWVHRYSDQLGLTDVPMIDDLYDDRLAAADAICFVGGTLGFLLGTQFDTLAPFRLIGGVLVTLGVMVFSINLLAVVYHHSPHTIGAILWGPLDPRSG